jgi:hypothetical protein
LEAQWDKDDDDDDIFFSLSFTLERVLVYMYVYIYIYMRDVLRRAQNAPVSLVLSTQGALVCKGRALIKPLSLLSLRAMMMSEAVLPTKFIPRNTPTKERRVAAFKTLNII